MHIATAHTQLSLLEALCTACAGSGIQAHADIGRPAAMHALGMLCACFVDDAMTSAAGSPASYQFTTVYLP
jgi:hypothetical protein